MIENYLLSYKLELKWDRERMAQRDKDKDSYIRIIKLCQSEPHMLPNAKFCKIISTFGSQRYSNEYINLLIIEKINVK